MSIRTRRPSRSRVWIASATSSRGASSFTKRSPSPVTSVAPSPRTASVMRKPSCSSLACTSAVGWNCMNSTSASSAPAACARVRPTPVAPRGLVVRSQRAAAPPVASTTARARSGRASPLAPRACTPMQRPSWTQSESAVVSSSTSTRSCRAASADRSRVIRRPVALPPAWTTRRREWPPSSPSASAPRRSASKRTPSASRSRTRSGASWQRTRPALSRAAPRPAAIVSAR